MHDFRASRLAPKIEKLGGNPKISGILGLGKLVHAQRSVFASSLLHPTIINLKILAVRTRIENSLSTSPSI